MPSTILSDNGVTSGTSGIKTTGSNDGTLALQTTTAGGAATTALSISTAQVVTLTNALPVASGGSGVTTSTGTGANVLGTSPTITTPTLASANITTALTLTGASGTNGQLLTSAGSGLAPTWTTVSVSAATPTALGTVYGKTDNSALTFVGYNAGVNSSGTGNTAFGYVALQTNTTGNYNTAVGWNAGQAATGSENAFFGVQAGSASTGGQNVAVGKQSLQQNTSGVNNAAVGFLAGGANTTGSYNAFFGSNAGQSVTTGGRNCLIGEAAGSGVTTANYSTLVGDNAGNSITSGSLNTCVGREAGVNLTTGYNNTVFGANCGSTVTTGADNVYIGYLAQASSSGVTYELAIGRSTTGKGQNTGYINANNGGVYQGNNSSSWSTTSDRRLKKNIVDNTEGLEIISQIRVRNFEYRTAEEVTELPEHTVVQKEGVQLGVIAQELQQVCSDCVKIETTGVMSVDSDNLFWHMVNAIKDLKAINDTQAATITALTARIVALEGQ